MDGAIGWIQLNNPDKHNALNQLDWLCVPQVVAFLLDQNIRAIILLGAGRSFCAGADISEFDEVRRNAATARVYETANAEAFKALRDAPVPTIAAISNICFGGGFGLAAACDLRICTDDAQFSVPAARLGLAYPVEAMADIVHAVGPQRAKHMLYTASRYRAADMLKFGFVLDIVENERLIERALDMAMGISELAPLTHRATKAAIDAAIGGGTSSDEAAALGDLTFESTDYAEGRVAFGEKRAAKFTGN